MRLVDPKAGRNIGLFSIAAFVVVALVIGQGVFDFAGALRGVSKATVSSPTPSPVPVTTPTPPPTSTAQPSPTSTAAPSTPTQTATATPFLTETIGLRRSFNQRPVAVMIDNLPDARPHSGMSEADVVYEAVTEGGITRFMAVFGDAEANVVGPVRSARHYFIYWASEYDAIYLHAGASPQGYDAADAIGLTRLDFTYGQGVYWRTSDRWAPHNLYTSIGRSRQLIAEAGRGHLGPLDFKEEAPSPGLATVDVTYPDGYRVTYEYRTSDNDFLRYMQRQPHIDAASGVQYHPKSVVVQFVNTWRIPGDTAGRVDMTLLGSGPAYFILDGKAIEGSWRKDALTSPTIFLDKRGKRVLLNLGQTWIQVVPAEGSVRLQ